MKRKIVSIASVAFGLSLYVHSISWASQGLLQVITFNTGSAIVAEKEWLPGVTTIIDTVPCRTSRLRAQLTEVPKILRPPFVLLLQEVHGRDAELTYSSMAKTNHYSMSGYNESGQVYTSGIVTISSEPIVSEKFTKFSGDRYENLGFTRGVLQTRILLQGAPVDVFNTHTTSGGSKNPGTGNESQKKHIRQLKEVAHAVGNSNRGILGGDFNLGADLVFPNWLPGTRNFDVRQIWADFLRNGLKERWIQSLLPPTQFTRDEISNPIARNSHWYIRLEAMKNGVVWPKRSTIDHIFSTSNIEQVGGAKLVLKDASVPACKIKDSNGNAALSDHFGVETFAKVEL